MNVSHSDAITSTNERITLSRSRITFIFAIIVLKAVVDYGYVFVLSPVWGYAGFTYDASIDRIVISYFLIIFCACFISTRFDQPMDVISVIFLAIAMVPIMTLYGYRNTDTLFMLTNVGFFLIMTLVSRIKPVAIKPLRNGTSIGLIFCISVLSLSLAWMLMQGGLSVINLNFARVYDFRDTAGALFDVGIFAYFNNWSYKIILPILIAVSLIKHQKLLSLAISMVGILFFAITSNKAALFLPLLVFLVFLARDARRPFGFIIWAISGITLFSIFSYFFLEDIWAPFVVLNRSLFAPSLNYVLYQEFFSVEGFVYMSNNVTSFLIDYPFDEIPAKLIAQFKYGSFETFVNAGLPATGFMHFGYIGVLFFGVIIGVILYLVNSISYNNLPTWFAGSVMAPSLLMTLTSADLTVGLLTNGVLPGLMLIWLFSGVAKSQNKQDQHG